MPKKKPRAGEGAGLGENEKEEENERNIEKEGREKKNLKEEEKVRMEEDGTMDSELKGGIIGITNKSFWSFKGFGRNFLFSFKC